MTLLSEGKLNDKFDFHETIDADHGQVELRRYWIAMMSNGLTNTRSGVD